MVGTKSMKGKNILITAGVIVTVMLLIDLFFLSFYSCTKIEKVEATLTVKIIPGKSMLGLNADTDALKFGVISPGIAAMRRLNVQHSEAASVQVRMQGELASWTSISPAYFNLSAGETKEVALEVGVPRYALPGNYTGIAVICIQEQ